jgi:hypothetical protein
MKTVDSAVDNSKSIVVNRRANNMAKTLSTGENKNYLKVTESEAAKKAEKGGLSIVTYTNPNSSKSGHVATYSVGDNLTKGKITNIGPSAFTGFVPLNRAIGKNRERIFCFNTKLEINRITAAENF